MNLHIIPSIYLKLIFTKFKSFNKQIKFQQSITKHKNILFPLTILSLLPNKYNTIQTKSSFLDCLNSFSFDNQRNQYIKSILSYTTNVNTKELAQALQTYSFDKGRIEFISLIVEKINDMDINEIIKCLKTFSFDKGKDEFLTIIQSKIKIDITDIGKINECFSFGSKNIILFTKNNFKNNTKQYSLGDFLQSLGNINDATKYIILNNISTHLKINNDSKMCEDICQYFKDIEIIKKIFRDYKIEDKLYEQYIKKIKQEKTKFWINNKEIIINEENNLQYTYSYGTLKIDISKGTNNCTIIFNGKKGSYSQISGISLEGLKLIVGESGIQMTGKK